jgi:hypothetical protein
LPSPSDPIHRLTTLRRVTDAVVAVALLGVAAWAIVPGRPRFEQPSESIAASAAQADAPNSPTLDTAAFDRALWFVPPPPPVMPPPPKPPEMPRLELVGIIRQGDTLRAMIVDAADNELRTVAVGDAFGVTEVLGITDRGVRCRAHGRDFDLLLDSGTGAAP